MQKIEANLEIMIKLQQQTQIEMQEEMKDLKNHQTGTKAVLGAVVESCNKNQQQLEDHKKDTNNRLQKFRESLLLLDLAMDKPSSTKSPRRKNPRLTLPPEQTNMSVDNNSDEESYGTVQPKPNTAPNTAPKSDDEMRVAAGGN
jgi:septal ring factor EnvC (AmiA/AmiB activator)